jgi:glycosyltransferase involved in cell wall biosynthesis
MAEPVIAVLIPCHNEEPAIGAVVTAFRGALPHAAIYVYDNNSTDRTPDVARAHGAIVRREALQGKGHVVRRMFADIDADIYVLVDGDGTYDAGGAPRLVQALIDDGLDMVNGGRTAVADRAFRPGHVVGNRMLTAMVGSIFGRSISDLLSGYRVLSRRFVKSFPVLSTGFEIETEMTVHALELDMPIAEIDLPYGERPAGSASKLHTLRDGIRIFLSIVRLVARERPLWFFTAIGAVLCLAAVALSIPVAVTYWETGLVPRLPTAVLSAAIMQLGFLSFAAGLVLDTVTCGRRETKRLHYLAQPRAAPAQPPPAR